jgi:hypothetical protein
MLRTRSGQEVRRHAERGNERWTRLMVLAQISLTDPGTLCLVVMAASAGFLLLRAHRHLSRPRREAGAPAAAQDWQADRHSAGDAPDDLARWEVEMHERARELSAQLDSKMSALAALVAEADRAAARLEAALARPAEAARKSGTQAEALCSPPQGLAASEPADRPPSSPRGHRHDEIYLLADYGFDSAEIARRVDSPIGEVELILSLRDRGG